MAVIENDGLLRATLNSIELSTLRRSRHTQPNLPNMVTQKHSRIKMLEAIN